MKRIIIWAACLLLMTAGGASAQSDALKLKDITNGTYSPEYVYGVNPMNDG